MAQERICVDPAVVEQQQNDQAVLDHQHRQYATLDAVCQGLVRLELAPAPDAVDIRVRRQLRVHHRHRAFVALQQVVLEEGAAGEGQHALPALFVAQVQPEADPVVGQTGDHHVVVTCGARGNR